MLELILAILQIVVLPFTIALIAGLVVWLITRRLEAKRDTSGVEKINPK